MDAKKAIMVYKISNSREYFVSTAFTPEDAVAIQNKVYDDPTAQFVCHRLVGGKEIHRHRVIKKGRSTNGI